MNEDESKAPEEKMNLLFEYFETQNKSEIISRAINNLHALVQLEMWNYDLMAVPYLKDNLGNIMTDGNGQASLDPKKRIIKVTP